MKPACEVLLYERVLLFNTIFTLGNPWNHTSSCRRVVQQGYVYYKVIVTKVGRFAMCALNVSEI